MYRKLSGLLLSVACVCTLTVSAAAAAPAIKTESTATAITKIYDYQPLATGKSGLVSTDALICTASERLCDSQGKYYRLVDSTPLHDRTLFSTKTEVNTGAGIVRTIQPIADPAEQNRSAFRIALTKEYSGQLATIDFTASYTAKQDTILNVRPVGGDVSEVQELPVSKGAKIFASSKLILNADTIAVSNYTQAHMKERLGK